MAPLDGYYTVEETEDMIAAHGLDVVRAFLWTPGETGKLVLNVEDNDLSGELAGYASAQAGRRNDAMAADLQQLLDGGEHVYALVLRGGAADIRYFVELHRQIVTLIADRQAERIVEVVKNHYIYWENDIKPGQDPAAKEVPG